MRTRRPQVLVRSIALAVALPSLGAVTFVLGDGRPPLREGLERVAGLVDATVRDAAGGRPVVADPFNADPTLADRLPTYRSLDDHSDSRRYPNYDDCDAGWHLVRDGWQTSHGYAIVLRDEGDRDVLLAAVRTYWEGLGYDVEPTGGRLAGVEVDLGGGDVRLVVDRERRVAKLSGVTDCLPPR